MIAIEEFKKKQTNKTRLIGLDLGSKRIGVSICDERQSIATPFKTLNKINTDKIIEDIKVIVEENNIEGIIIGNPINMDGSLGPSAQSISDIAKNILNKLVSSRGIGFPMASAILKFTRPDIFPIIDVRAYRALTGKKIYYSQYTIDLYIKYVEQLKIYANKLNIPLSEMDEQLYEFDKEHNKKI